MNKENSRIDRIKIGLMVGLLVSLTGCAGYYGAGDYDGGTVVVSEPDQFLFGGDYNRGRDVHNYSHRGSESRAVVHSSGSHAVAHAGRDRGGKR